MFKLSKKIKELEKRLSKLEAHVLATSQKTPTVKQGASLSYEEVIYEWLNGEKK